MKNERTVTLSVLTTRESNIITRLSNIESSVSAYQRDDL